MSDLSEIFELTAGREIWTGIVFVQIYAQYRLQRLQLNSDLAKRATLQVLPYALKQVTELLIPEDLSEYDTGIKPRWKELREEITVYDPNIRRNLPHDQLGLVGNMFPTETQLCSALSEFMSIDVHTLPALPQDTLISDLPLFMLYREDLSVCANALSVNRKRWHITRIVLLKRRCTA